MAHQYHIPQQASERWRVGQLCRLEHRDRLKRCILPPFYIERPDKYTTVTDHYQHYHHTRSLKNSRSHFHVLNNLLRSFLCQMKCMYVVISYVKCLLHNWIDLHYCSKYKFTTVSWRLHILNKSIFVEYGLVSSTIVCEVRKKR